MTDHLVLDNGKQRRIMSPGYNLVFDRETGFMARWGKTKEEDPQMCPWGPEIADIEVSTVCNGVGKTMDSRVPCSWCYKSNTGVGKNMTLDTFKRVVEKLSQEHTLTQIALGIGDVEANPDLWNIMGHCRDNQIVPNVTVNGMVTTQQATGLAFYCGAVAVSHYGIDDICFDTVKALTDRGMDQVNIHKLLSRETYDSCLRLIEEVKRDPRLAKLKAIVFLLLKPKGKRNWLHSIEEAAQYGRLLEHAQKHGVAVGMDSCSAPMALKSLPSQFHQSIEPCESTLFSLYVNVDGEAFPCSFTEGTPGWERGIELAGPTEPGSLAGLWYHPRIVEWRTRLLESSGKCDCSLKDGCRSCPVYDVTTCNRKPDVARIGRSE